MHSSLRPHSSFVLTAAVLFASVASPLATRAFAEDGESPSTDRVAAADSAATMPVTRTPPPTTPQSIAPPPSPASLAAPPSQPANQSSPWTPQVSLSSAVTAFPSDATAESLLVFVEMRGGNEVRADLDRVLEERGFLEIESQNQKSLQARSEAYTKLKLIELESLKTRVDLAGKEKKDVEKKELERQKKIGEAQLSILRKLGELRKKEMETTKAKLELNETLRKSLELEAQLATRRHDREEIARKERTTSVLKSILETDRKIRDLEGKVLSSQVDVAKKRGTLAGRQIQILEARRKIFESESKLLEERAR